MAGGNKRKRSRRKKRKRGGSGSPSPPASPVDISDEPDEGKAAVFPSEAPHGLPDYELGWHMFLFLGTNIYVDIMASVMDQILCTCFICAILYAAEQDILRWLAIEEPDRHPDICFDFDTYVAQYECEVGALLGEDVRFFYRTKDYRPRNALNIFLRDGVLAYSKSKEWLGGKMIKISSFALHKDMTFTEFENIIASGGSVIGGFPLGREFKKLRPDQIYEFSPVGTKRKPIGAHMVQFIGTGIHESREFLVFLNSKKRFGKNGVGKVYFDQIYNGVYTLECRAPPPPPPSTGPALIVAGLDDNNDTLGSSGAAPDGNNMSNFSGGPSGNNSSSSTASKSLSQVGKCNICDDDPISSSSRAIKMEGWVPSAPAVKETPEPRSRAANNVTSRGVRGVPARGGRNSSVYQSSTSTDNTTSRSSVSGPGMPSTNSTQKQTVPNSSVNKNVVADTPSVPPQTSSGFQHSWSGTPGQLSMADIVKIGRPQAQGKPFTKPVVTADKGYAGQYPSLPTTVNQNIKQSASTVPPTELNQGLPSAQDSVLVKDHIHPAADNKQNYDNDWSIEDVPLSGNQSYLPETSGDPSLYETPLHQSTLVVDVGYSHEKSYLDENISAAVRPVNASERHLDHFGGNSEYNDGLLQNSSAYSHTEDQVEKSNTDVSAAANFQGLSLHDEELAATKFAEDNPAVIIPDHLQVANTGCAGSSFGSFESGAFSGLLPQKSTDNNSEVPVVEESEAVDHTDTRDEDLYEVDAVNPSANENLEHIMGANTGNLYAPSVPQPDVLRQEILDDPSAVQYNLSSVSSHGYSNPAEPNAMEAMQGSNQAHTLSHLSNLLQANTLQHNLLGSNMPPLRHLDFALSPLLAAQARSMGKRYNSAAPTTIGQTISMQEPPKSGVFSNTQSTQNLPSSSIQTGPRLPQQLVHPYSQPTLPIAPFTNMIGYPYLAAQDHPAAYLPSTAFQQAYSSNGQFHQSAAAVPGAGMKYSMPQYKNMPDTNLQQQQQPWSVISGYGGFGSSSNLPTNFALNRSAAPAAANPFDEVMSAQYKAANQYMAALQQQQVENSAMWHHGAGTRTASALPPTQFYGYQVQSQQQQQQQQAGFRQAQQPSQFGSHGYPAFYHSQGGMTHNPADGSLNGYQVAPSQHQSWQQHSNCWSPLHSCYGAGVPYSLWSKAARSS